METFGVTRRHVYTLSKKLGKTTFKEKRQHTTPSKFTPDDRKLVHHHINSIPRDMSHYSRQKTEKNI